MVWRPRNAADVGDGPVTGPAHIVGAATAPVVEAAPAKLNLDLYVEGRRADGYHLLDSVTAFTCFGDTLQVQASDGPDDRVVLQGPFAPVLAAAGESLVARAFAGLRRLARSEQRFEAALVKRIPVAAGLGGGSADAAAALRAGARLLGLDLEDPRVAALALSLGADVPVCLGGAPVRMRGIGEDLGRPPRLPDPALVLVNPGVETATGAVFRALDPARFAPAPDRADDAAPMPGWFVAGRNDLEAAAVRVAPAIAEVVGHLRDLGAPVVRLCGSGATVFAAFTTDDAATAAAGAVRATRPCWWVETTRLRR